MILRAILRSLSLRINTTSNDWNINWEELTTSYWLGGHNQIRTSRAKRGGRIGDGEIGETIKRGRKIEYKSRHAEGRWNARNPSAAIRQPTLSPRARARHTLQAQSRSRCFLRSANFLLQNCAIPRNAAHIGFVPSTYEKQAVQRCEKVRNSLGLN